MVFTDPPYNVPIVGHVSGKGRARHREFHEASGEMTRSGFTAFLDEVLANTAHSCRNGAISFVCMDWRHIGELLEAGQRAFDAYLNLCVWAKTNGGMGSLYRSQHELVFVFRKGKAQHRNNVQLGRFGRNRTNVWTYAGVNTFREGRMEELSAHPTAKPVAMVKDAILDVTKRGEVVLDPFLGGGATLMAAEQSGRVAYGSTKRAVRYMQKGLRKDTMDTPVQICTMSPGIVVTDLLTGDYDLTSEQWEKSKKIFNILGDDVQTVTPWLVEHILATDKSGAKVAWLTRRKAFGRFMTAGFKKRDLFKDVEHA